jgi:hypothetical protein
MRRVGSWYRHKPGNSATTRTCRTADGRWCCCTASTRRRAPSRGSRYGLLFALSFPLLSQGLYDLLTSRPSIRYFLRQSFVDDAPAEMVEYAYATSHQQGAKLAPLYFLVGKLFTSNAYNDLYARLQLPVLVLI